MARTTHMAMYVHYAQMRINAPAVRIYTDPVHGVKYAETNVFEATGDGKKIVTTSSDSRRAEVDGISMTLI